MIFCITTTISYLNHTLDRSSNATMGSEDTTHSHHAVEKDVPEDKNSKQVPKEDELRNKAASKVWSSTDIPNHLSLIHI